MVTLNGRDTDSLTQPVKLLRAYCIKRWELSRPRAYQLCAASEVMTDLSTTVDSALLPETEWQIRPLTRLKETEHRKRAWDMAVEMAVAEQRPVTARDTEEAVRKLNGKSHMVPICPDGEPVYTCVQGTNADLIATVAQLYLSKG